jgi:hypothetical protein
MPPQKKVHYNWIISIPATTVIERLSQLSLSYGDLATQSNTSFRLDIQPGGAGFEGLTPEIVNIQPFKME